MRVRHYLDRVSLDRDAVTDWDSYPFSMPAVRGLREVELHPKVTFFVGENGSGKSTLLESIAEKLGFHIQGGTWNTNKSQKDPRAPLTPLLKLIRPANRPQDGFFLRAESFYNFATLIDEYGPIPYGGKSLHHQSHGESFLAVMMHRFGGQGIYLLDEPEAALSPQHQLSMLVRLHDLVLDSSQFIVATHSPLLMAYPDCWIYQFSQEGIGRIAYEDTDHYRITRSLMRDHAGMMRGLLRREGELDLED